jgi:hypothetical protein
MHAVPVEPSGLRVVVAGPAPALATRSFTVGVPKKGRVLVYNVPAAALQPVLPPPLAPVPAKPAIPLGSDQPPPPGPAHTLRRSHSDSSSLSPSLIPT